MSTAPRSWLYVPGHRADRVSKALAPAADAVVVDLEDAVPAAPKDDARRLTVASLDDRPQGTGPPAVGPDQPAGTEAGRRDVDCAGRTTGRRAARTAGRRSRRRSARSPSAPERASSLLLESALGLLAGARTGPAHELVAGIGLGEADLAADLLVDREEGLAWARGSVVARGPRGRAASPIQSVWTDVGDLDGLRTSASSAGPSGSSAARSIHPRQIDVGARGVHPVAGRGRRGRAVVATAAEARARGEAAALDEQRPVRRPGRRGARPRRARPHALAVTSTTIPVGGRHETDRHPPRRSDPLLTAVSAGYA